jgi:DNA polymerase sigma
MNIEQKNLQYLCLTQLSRSSIMELLDKFFRYYVEEFDTFKNVISIRNLFHPMDCTPIPLLNKSIWKKNPVLWRLSIEDPCDPIILSNNNDATSPRANSSSSTAFDLGSSLSRPGQLTVSSSSSSHFYFFRLISLSFL